MRHLCYILETFLHDFIRCYNIWGGRGVGGRLDIQNIQIDIQIQIFICTFIYTFIIYKYLWDFYASLQTK